MAVPKHHALILPFFCLRSLGRRAPLTRYSLDDDRICRRLSRKAEDTLRRLAQRIINAQHRYVAAPRSWRELVGASGAEALKRQNLTANRIRWNFCLCQRPMAVLCVFGNAVSLPSTYNVVTHHAQRKGWPDRCTLSAVSCSAFHSNGV